MVESGPVLVAILVEVVDCGLAEKEVKGLLTLVVANAHLVVVIYPA